MIVGKAGCGDREISTEFGKVKFEVSVNFQVKQTFGCMNLELKKEVRVGDKKSQSHQIVYSLNPED